MKKEEFIKQYGETAYEKRLEQTRRWNERNSEKVATQNAAWREANPEKIEAIRQEQARKGGKYYEKRLEYNRTGLRGKRNKIRVKHGTEYRPYKKIIAPKSVLHHQWIPGTAKYHGVALVEKDPHQYGIIDVIKILDGKITLLTEEEIRNQGS